MRAAIFVDAPVARPLGLDARRARRVPRTVEVGKVPAHKILVRLRRPHLYDKRARKHPTRKKKRKEKLRQVVRRHGKRRHMKDTVHDCMRTRAQSDSLPTRFSISGKTIRRRRRRRRPK